MCKKRIEVDVCIEGVSCRRVQAELHPKGCMHAMRTHLDIPIVEGLEMLAELGKKRGLHLDYTIVGDCLVLETSGLPTTKICSKKIPKPATRRVLLRVLRPGRIYIGL